MAQPRGVEDYGLMDVELNDGGHGRGDLRAMEYNTGGATFNGVDGDHAQVEGVGGHILGVGSELQIEVEADGTGVAGQQQPRVGGARGGVPGGKGSRLDRGSGGVGGARKGHTGRGEGQLKRVVVDIGAKLNLRDSESEPVHGRNIGVRGLEVTEYNTRLKIDEGQGAILLVQRGGGDEARSGQRRVVVAHQVVTGTIEDRVRYAGDGLGGEGPDIGRGEVDEVNEGR